MPVSSTRSGRLPWWLDCLEIRNQCDARAPHSILANTETVRRIVERVIDERPVAILIAGDFPLAPDRGVRRAKRATKCPQLTHVSAFELVAPKSCRCSSR